MRRALLIAAGLSLAACVTTAPRLGAGERWHREGSFCIALAADESIEREDPGTDFFLYHYRRGDRHIVIYEGNHPQRGGIILQTGQRFPAVLSVHGDPALARRMLVGERAAACN